MRRPFALATFLVLSAGLATADESPDFGSTLTGGWGGWRTSGLALEGAFKADVMSNRGGTLGRGNNTSTHLELTAKADFDRLWGWHGGSGMLQVINNNGGDLNIRRTGSSVGVTNIAVPVPTTRLFQA